MAQKIDIPGTGQDLDPTDGMDWVMTLVLLVGGFAVLTIGSVLGRNVADSAFEFVGDLTGINPSGGQPIEIV